ncbi:MAG: nuclear transport factor 2 family protein [Gammaproteobacteria bacterium]
MHKELWQAWIEGYLRAWKSNDPADIGRLFTPDARYYTAPFREPWAGRDGIIAGWLNRQDAPGDFTFAYELLAVDGNLGVMRGRTNYVNEPPREYHNLWLIRLADSGQCTEFTEFWMLRS